MRTIRLWLATMVALVGLAAGAQAQVTVTAAEYFFDTDPGYGQATAINNMVEGQQTIAVSTRTLSAGAHTLCLRTMGSNGIWSTTLTTPLYIINTGGSAMRIEYFFDQDPGYGQGTYVAASGTQQTVSINTDALSPGAHMLYLRTQGTNGQWSTTMARPIYVFTILPVEALEYYIDDNDPGEGQATAVPVATATAATAIFDIDTSTLTAGEHTLNIRAMGIDSVWTAVSSRTFTVTTAAPEPYAVLTDNETVLGENASGTIYGKTLTFYYDDQKAVRGGMSVGPFESAASVSWNSQLADITSVVFDGSLADCTTLTSTAWWFAACINLEDIQGIENLNTANVTDMQWMFSECYSLRSLDLSTFNTASVTNMQRMFDNCSSLTTIYADETTWSTANVTNGENMFNMATAIVGGNGTTFDASHIDHEYARIDKEGQPGYLTGKTDAREAYAVLSENNTVLTFYYDDQKETRGGMSVGPFAAADSVSWASSRQTITTVVFDASCANDTTLTSTAFWFYECGNLTSITDINYLRTDHVTNMSYMFEACSGLTTLDVSNFNTANVTNMYGMFSGCSSLTTLDVSNFNTANVTNMSWMFSRCSGLTTLDVTNFNTANVTYMSGMFDGCSGLTTLDVSNFNTSNVTDMSWMFDGCSGLTTLDVSNFNTANVTNMSRMFSGCSGLTTLDVSNFNTANVTDMSYMFCNCQSLTTLDVSNFNTANVTNMSGMFYGCSGLTTLDVSNFNTANVTDMYRMFYGCSGLQTIYAGQEWSTANVTSSDGMFTDCTNLVGGMGTVYDENHVDATYAHIDEGTANPGYLTYKNAPIINKEHYAVLSDNNTLLTFYYDDQKVARGGMSVGPFTDERQRAWNDESASITKVVIDESFANDTTLTSTAHWFSLLTNLTTIEGIRNLPTSRVENMRYMFHNCNNLYSVDVSGFQTDNVTDMSCMFFRCSALSRIDVSHFNTANVTSMSNMFTGCYNLTKLDVTNFVTDNVTSMAFMFNSCSGLTSIDLSHFNTSNVTMMHSMFAGCTGLSTIDLSSFNTENTQYMNQMFEGCQNLTTIYASNLWSTASVTEGGSMFYNCYSLVGGMGTVFDSNHIDHAYAHIDGGTANPGYFTDKNAPVIADVEPYAVLSDSSTVLTFYYDDQKVARGGMSVGPFIGYPDYQSWYAERRSITTVVFDESFANCTTLTSTAYWFYECSNLTSITNIEFLKTDNVTNMSYMFSYCSGLTSLDLTNFRTDNVTDMSYMFSGCWNITRLDVSGFNTEHVTNIGYMFEGCSNLTSLDVSGFKTDNVWGMYGMFAHCSNLKNLDVSRFNTANVTDMRFMFRNCSSLTSIDVSGFNTANVTDMYGMFSGCTKLTSLDVSRFNTANVREMAYMFSLSSGLTSLDLSGFNTSNVTNMREMFEGCSNLTTIYASSDWSTAAVEYGNDMFYACTNLVGGMGTVYDENNVDYTYAHIDGGPANPGYFTDKNAPVIADVEPYAVLSDSSTVLTFYYDDQMQARGGMSVGPFTYTYDGTYITDVVRPGWFGQRESITRVIFDASFANCTSLTSTAFWFYRCNNLITITGIEHLKTDNVTDMGFMFDGCSSLTSLDVSGFNTSNVERFCALFAGCSSLTSIDVSHFNTSNAWDFRLMFSQCSSLTELDVSHFNTQKATGMGGMFQVCSKLTKLDLHNFNTENVFGMGWMFTGCSSLLHLDISGFNTSSAGEMFYMFDECPSLASIMAGNAVIPDSIYAQIGNPNLLVYVNSEATAPTIINNVVVNGVARNIVLTDALTGYGNFNCPQAFRAEHISYRHYFHQETQPGVSRGWEGIALPFNVQTITHEHHGALHPFGTPEEGYPFWLRQLTPNGIVQAVRMIANRPYIISMPNSQAYHDEYNQSGWVTFAANDVTVPVTTTMVTALADSSIVMIPTMQRVEQATDVYAINRSQPYAGYPEGSIFVSNLREVRPFEAYTEHRSASPAPMFYPIDAWMDGGTGIDEMENELLTIDNAYNLNGQRVKTPRKGVFIVNGRKTVVK